MAPKYSLARLMAERDLTVTGLADKSGISGNTMRRALRGDKEARLNTTSATAIAAALDLPVGKINWPSDLANGGRPAGSKSGYTRRPN